MNHALLPSLSLVVRSTWQNNSEITFQNCLIFRLCIYGKQKNRGKKTRQEWPLLGINYSFGRQVPAPEDTVGIRPGECFIISHLISEKKVTIRSFFFPFQKVISKIRSQQEFSLPEYGSAWANARVPSVQASSKYDASNWTWHFQKTSTLATNRLLLK